MIEDYILFLFINLSFSGLDMRNEIKCINTIDEKDKNFAEIADIRNYDLTLNNYK